MYVTYRLDSYMSRIGGFTVISDYLQGKNDVLIGFIPTTPYGISFFLQLIWRQVTTVLPLPITGSGMTLPPSLTNRDTVASARIDRHHHVVQAHCWAISVDNSLILGGLLVNDGMLMTSDDSLINSPLGSSLTGSLNHTYVTITHGWWRLVIRILKLRSWALCRFVI